MFNETLDCYNVVEKKEEGDDKLQKSQKYLTYQII